jgi:hypothetical protein
VPYEFKVYTPPRGGLKDVPKISKSWGNHKLPEDETDRRIMFGRNPFCRLNWRLGLKKFLVVPNT